MRRKARKKAIDENLLHTIYSLQSEWKKIASIVEESIDPSDRSLYQEKVARAKYIFLLQEARQRNLSAIRYK